MLKFLSPPRNEFPGAYIQPYLPVGVAQSEILSKLANEGLSPPTIFSIGLREAASAIQQMAAI